MRSPPAASAPFREIGVRAAPNGVAAPRAKGTDTMPFPKDVHVIRKGHSAGLPRRKLSVEEFADWSGLSVSTINKMRLHGTGPSYLKFGRRVLYDLEDLEAWATQRRRSHTSE